MKERKLEIYTPENIAQRGVKRGRGGDEDDGSLADGVDAGLALHVVDEALR